MLRMGRDDHVWPARVMAPSASRAHGRRSDMREVILWGGTGQARVLNECLYNTDDKIVAVFDNADVAAPFSDIPFHVGEDGFRSWRQARRSSNVLYFLIAVGGPQRLMLHDWLADEGLLPLTVIHRAAYVAADATLGPGCQILAHATVCARARLERSAAQGVERRDRGIDVYRRAAVEREIDFLFVLVLPEQLAPAAARSRECQRREEQENPTKVGSHN